MSSISPESTLVFCLASVLNTASDGRVRDLGQATVADSLGAR